MTHLDFFAGAGGAAHAGAILGWTSVGHVEMDHWPPGSTALADSPPSATGGYRRKRRKRGGG